MESIAETNHSISQSVKQSGIATLEIEGAVNEINNGSEQAKDRVVRLSAISTQISKLADELEKRARQFKL